MMIDSIAVQVRELMICGYLFLLSLKCVAEMQVEAVETTVGGLVSCPSLSIDRNSKLVESLKSVCPRNNLHKSQPRQV